MKALRTFFQASVTSRLASRPPTPSPVSPGDLGPIEEENTFFDLLMKKHENKYLRDAIKCCYPIYLSFANFFED